MFLLQLLRCLITVFVTVAKVFITVVKVFVTVFITVTKVFNHFNVLSQLLRCFSLF